MEPQPITAEQPGVSVEILELLAEVLSVSDHGGPGDGFYDRICEFVCRVGRMHRALILRYDADSRRVRAVGAHGIDISKLSGLLSVRLAPITGRALLADEVLEAEGDLREQVTPEYAQWFPEPGRLVCAPMSAAGRAIGVILVDRTLAQPPFDAAERHLLWTLGKAAALAAVAREMATEHERALQLQQRIDLAREMHDGVVQRLFAVSMALDGNGDLPAEVRISCAQQTQLALGELRDALKRPLGRDAPATRTTFANELARLADAYPELGLRLVAAQPVAVPPELEPLAQSFLLEAVRNAVKHAHASFVTVSVEHREAALIIEVVNDGVGQSRGAPGIGLRLLSFEALQLGGIVEFGPLAGERWHLRLLVPDRD